MEGLKLVKQRGGYNVLPNKEALEKAVALVVAGNSVKAAKYLRDGFAARLKDLKMVDQGAEVMKKLDEIVDYMKLKVEDRAIWRGDTSISTEYQKFQKSLATEAAAMLNDMFDEGSVTYHYAVSDDSDLVRGYMNDKNQEPSTETVTAIDNMFNAWLAENNMKTEDGVIYEIEDDGTVKSDGKDNNGDPIPKRADAEKLRQKINNEFAKYVNKNNKDNNNEVKFSVKQESFPAQNVEAEKGAGAAGG